MDTYIFRHGETDYRQGKTLLSTADDLTPEGIIQVKASADDLADRLTGERPIQIHSSPYGRCLHTAKVIRGVLEDKGLETFDIKEDGLIGEVQNFDWKLFDALVAGGEVEYETDKFVVDKVLTNPLNLSPVEYFRKDLAHKLSLEAKKTMPIGYLNRIASFELYPSVTARLNLKLESLRGRSGEVQIISIHEGLTGELVKQLDSREDAFLDKGKYFGVKMEHGIFVSYKCQEDAII